MLPSHLRAMHDIEPCRTAARGGQLYFCHQLSRAALQLSLLQEPSLSQVPKRPGQSVARRTTESAAARALLPGHLSPCPPNCGPWLARTRRRSTTCSFALPQRHSSNWPRTRALSVPRSALVGVLADLDPRPPLSPPRPFHRHWRRPDVMTAAGALQLKTFWSLSGRSACSSAPSFVTL